jgi:uncharacterized membrane protein
MAEKTVVLSIFENEAAADAAVEALKLDGIAANDAMGVLVLGADGKVKTDKVGTHSAGKGAGIGFVLGLLGPVGWGLGLGIGMGATTGAVLGLLHHKGLGLHDADRERISAALSDGKAAVGVLTPVGESQAVEAKLAELGGETEARTIEEDDAAQAQQQALQEEQGA